MPNEHSILPVISAFTDEFRARRNGRRQQATLVRELSEYKSGSEQLELYAILDRHADEHAEPVRQHLREAS